MIFLIYLFVFSKKNFGNKANEIKQWVLGYGFKNLKSLVEKQAGVLKGILNGKSVEIKHLEDFYLSASEIKEI